MSDEINLKPCPFCGSMSVYVEQIGSEGYFNICCGNCLANVPLSGSRETAVAAWNSRDDAAIAAWNRRAIDRAELLAVADECDVADVDTDWAERIRKAVGE